LISRQPEQQGCARLVAGSQLQSLFQYVSLEIPEVDAL
jgi:hypothetical protein